MVEAAQAQTEAETGVAALLRTHRLGRTDSTRLREGQSLDAAMSAATVAG